MGIVNDRMEEILSIIEPTTEEITFAQKRFDDIRSLIEYELEANTYISGSYQKNTAISPLNDVDIFVWLPKSYAKVETLKELQKKDTKKLLERFKRKVQTLEIPHFQIPIQDHSIGIKYEGTNFSFDLIPAFSAIDPKNGLNFDRLFHIPEKGTNHWVQTEPKVDRTKLSEINKSNKGKPVKLIKLFKAWRSTIEEKTIKSYHLQTMIEYIATETSVFKQRKNMIETLYDVTQHLIRIMSNRIKPHQSLRLRTDPSLYLHNDSKREKNILINLQSLVADLEYIFQHQYSNQEFAIQSLNSLFNVDEIIKQKTDYINILKKVGIGATLAYGTIKVLNYLNSNQEIKNTINRTKKSVSNFFSKLLK